MTAPYAQAALEYRRLGWAGVLPVGNRPGEKAPVPDGYTGNAGVWPTNDQINEWVSTKGKLNIALRLPKDVIGIDVDTYDGKPGKETMLAVTERHGRLPKTWISTSREGLSGIRWYRIETTAKLPGKLIHPDDQDISGVEIIQYSHRYAVVPPSIHPGGNPYIWRHLNTEVDAPPPEDLPHLPDQWVDHILKDCSCHGGITLTLSTADPVQDAYDKWSRRLTEAYGRHDAALGGIMALTAFAQRNWPHATEHLNQLKHDFIASLGDSRSQTQAEAEWQRMIDGAETKAVTSSLPYYIPDTPPKDHDTLEPAVQQELNRLRIRDRAQQLRQAETNPPPEIPRFLTLTQREKIEHPPVAWRIQEWQPAESRVLLAAQYKAGKTTLTGNLARCLADGDWWLDKDPVTPVRQPVTILDFEMSERQMDEWLIDQEIRHTELVVAVPLRGRASSFNILNDRTRTEWANRLAGSDYVILDCLRPILDALGLDEHRDAGQFLVAFDELCNEAGVTDSLIVHHMGHQGERSRGDSRLRDWPDVEWRLVRSDDNPNSPRFLSAFGRDVDVWEGELVYNGDNRHLKWRGGDRANREAREAIPDILSYISKAEDAPTQRAIETGVEGHSRTAIRKGIGIAEHQGLLHRKQGPRQAWLHYLGDHSE